MSYDERVLVRLNDSSELSGKLRAVTPQRRQIITNIENEKVVDLRFEEPWVVLHHGFADVIGIPLSEIHEIVLLS